ncbi:hypothetical protein HHK36_032292 [Tetracentron sinense]|uniref:Transcription factor GAMYB n=1 Tax=Tetracentron sinense TaxID=13715 RepID=A0A834Y9D9_TETSI|nr:hypothetical protein HHK36_032292 [Tetracentron sinense]
MIDYSFVFDLVDLEEERRMGGITHLFEVFRVINRNWCGITFKEMSHTTNESEDGMLSKDQIDSPSIDEGSCGGSFVGGSVLKKGPWTSAEDAILVEYVKKHGEGNWNAVQKHSGLFRCGKSCRLRWANHLRPNLRKGAFTVDEERLIIELHAKMGNKWARMAAHRRQRAGLPLYPPDVCLQVLNENQQSQNSGEFNSGDSRHHDFLHTNNYEIPDVIFNNLKASQGALSFAPALPDISLSSMITQGLGSAQMYSFMPPTMHRPKRLRESETLFSGFNGSVSNGLPVFDQFQNDTCEKIVWPFGLSFPYDPDPNIRNPPPFGAILGSHAFLNGNISASKPIPGAVKLELPSLQYSETDLGSWGISSPPPPSLESVDAFIQSPPPAGSMQSDCLSPENNGLLETLIHESHTLSSGKNNSSEKSLNSSIVIPCDIVDSSTLNLCGRGWKEYGDPISPLGCSAASVFSECTPISRSSLDEPPPADTLPGCIVKPEPVHQVSTPDGEEKEKSTRLDFSRPDALLGSDWFEQSTQCDKDHSVMTDSIETLFGEDFYSDYKHMAGTSTLSQVWGNGSCVWNNMPAVYQMSELP